MVDPDAAAEFINKPDGFHARLAALDLSLVDETLNKKALVLSRARILRETNPMLGHRGVRLGISVPEIYRMQIRAVLEAAAACVQEGIGRTSGDHDSSGVHADSELNLGP